MVQLSIIIVNYNVRYFLEQALYSVRKSSQGLQVEIIVVDNASSDQSVEMVQANFPEVKVIANKQNVGFAVANNQAIRIARGEYVLLLNPDTVLEESTLQDCCEYMENHAEVGALGVKMLDGRGDFLPESKRAMPTPWVAFTKLFGLSALFPKSKWFSTYHLGYLDADTIHEVDILAGAFMFMRKKALDKVGLLDESFFMYGEDIDLSYRFIQAGYKNVYFPQTKIIHYKGESTKKGSINYVRLFYMAMIIFAKKHFSPVRAGLYSGALYIGIAVKGIVALIHSLIQKIGLWILDGTISFIGLYVAQQFWATKVKGSVDYYPDLFVWLILPMYAFIWIAAGYIGGIYQRPYKISPIVKAVAIGTVVISAVYGFLPEHLRFSRAIILMGGMWTFLAMMLNRVLYNWGQYKTIALDGAITKRTIIVGGQEERIRAKSLLEQTSSLSEFIGYVSVEKEALRNDLLGEVDQLAEVVHLYEANEVLFCTADVSYKRMMHLMTALGNAFEYKTVSENGTSIIGSNSIHSSGDIYAIDVDLKIGQHRSRQIKRMFDLLLSILFLAAFPVIGWFMGNKKRFLANLFAVLVSSKTWVGYIPVESDQKENTLRLPPLKKGVISPLHSIQTSQKDVKTLNLAKANLLYAKHYSVYKDLQYIIKGFAFLDR